MPPDRIDRAVEDAPGDQDRLEHMLSAARDAVRFIAGRSRADLEADPMLRRALTNCVQEIGEAAARTSAAGRARVPGLPWGSIVMTRHILVHAYFQIDLDVVWNVAHQHLPQMIAAVDRALTEWPERDE